MERGRGGAREKGANRRLYLQSTIIEVITRPNRSINGAGRAAAPVALYESAAVVVAVAVVAVPVVVAARAVTGVAVVPKPVAMETTQ